MHIQHKISIFDYTKFDQYTLCTVLLVYLRIYFVHKAHNIESHAVIIVREYVPYIQNTQQESHKQNIQGEHKNTPWFQVVMKSKLTGIFLQNWWLQLHKLIQFHVVSHTLNVPPSCYSANKFWFYNYLKSRSVFVFTLYVSKCASLALGVSCSM